MCKTVKPPSNRHYSFFLKKPEWPMGGNHVGQSTRGVITNQAIIDRYSHMKGCPINLTKFAHIDYCTSYHINVCTFVGIHVCLHLIS